MSVSSVESTSLPALAITITMRKWATFLAYHTFLPCPKHERHTDQAIRMSPRDRADKVFTKIPLNIPYRTIIAETPGLVCASCGKELAPHSSILDVKRGQRNYSLSEPIDWMAP